MGGDELDSAALGTLPQLHPRILDRVEIPLDRGEVLRYLGYPAGAQPNRRLKEMLDHWVPEAGRRAKPRAIYAIFPVCDIGKRQLRLKTARGTAEFRGAIGEFLGMARYVAAFIATAGPDVELLAGELMRGGDPLAALIVDAVGSERAEAAEIAVIDQLRLQTPSTGLVPTLPYSPGYCGMSVTEQTELFALFGHQPVGVVLSPECLMKPLKSVSGLIGLGPPQEVKQFGSPCDRCDLRNCNMRR